MLLFVTFFVNFQGLNPEKYIWKQNNILNTLANIFT